MSQISDQIKDKIDIVDLVKEYIPELKKAGVSWKARCPFHQEKTASFIVSPEKQIWHCFGCHKGGDAFGFIKEAEGVEFVDAMRLLAKRAGITLSRQNPKEESERTRLLDILRATAAWYHQALLRAKSAEHARGYLAERMVNEEARDAWQIGFAPDAWEGVSAYLASRGFRPQEIERAGISSRNDRGSVYDRFRNRLMFPISDAHGTIVGFTGRKLADDDLGGKYINTPETPLYHKSSVLYGLSKAKQAIRSADLAIVVEGNMDCVSSHQAGVSNVVAASGTALTGEQVRLLKRYTKNVALAFDPDAAGQEALMRGLAIAWEEELTIQVIALPGDADPDDVIRADPKQWKALIEARSDFMDWLFASTKARHDITTANGKKQASKLLLNWIRRLPDMVEQTHYLQQLASLVSVDEAVLRSIIVKISRPERARSKAEDSQSAPAQNVQDKMATRLLALVLATDHTVPIPTDWLPHEYYERLYKRLVALYDSGAYQTGSQLLNGLEAPLEPLGRAVVLLADEIRSSMEFEDRRKEINGLVLRLKQTYLRKHLDQLRLSIREAEQRKDETAVQEYVTQWQRLNQELHRSK